MERIYEGEITCPHCRKTIKLKIVSNKEAQVLDVPTEVNSKEVN